MRPGNPVQPPPEPDTVATLLTERAQLRARVADLEAELAEERRRTNQAVVLAARPLGPSIASVVPQPPGWRAPGW